MPKDAGRVGHRKTVSIAYGWTPDGRAIVRLLSSPCAGIRVNRRGFYLISRTGHRKAIRPALAIACSTQPRPVATLRARA
jgi:hypothetical protein